MSQIQDSRSKIQNIPGPLAFSVALHMVAFLCLGVSYAPEKAREAGPMVMWLVNAESRTQNTSDFALRTSTYAKASSFAKASEDKSVDKSTDRERRTQEKIAQPLISEGKPESEVKQLAVVSKQPEAVPELAAISSQLEVAVQRTAVTIQPPAFSYQPETKDKPSEESLLSAVVGDPGTRHHPPSLAPADQLRRTGTPDTSLLAFVGDPVAAGIIPLADGDGLLAAKVLSFPEPKYPTISRRRGEEGRVVIKVEISTMGEVRSAKVHSSSSYPRLDRAALAAVELARFSPAVEYGRPVESERTVAYRFRLTK